MLSKLLNPFEPNLYSDKTTSTHHGGPAHAYNKSKMADGCHIKNIWFAITPQTFIRFCNYRQIVATNCTERSSLHISKIQDGGWRRYLKRKIKTVKTSRMEIQIVLLDAHRWNSCCLYHTLSIQSVSFFSSCTTACAEVLIHWYFSLLLPFYFYIRKLCVSKMLRNR